MSEDELLTAVCEVCNGRIYWWECPTGGWWTHFNHPADEHDGQAPAPTPGLD